MSKPSYGGLTGAVESLKKKAADMEVDYQAEMNVSTMDYGGFGQQYSTKEQAEDAYRSEYGDQIRKQFDDLPGLCQPYTQMPDPASFQGLIDALPPALTRLAGPRGHKDFTDKGGDYGPYAAYKEFDGDADALKDWTGDAAFAFRHNFLPPFEGVIWNEFSVVCALRGALMAEHQLWSKGRDDICQLVGDTDAALDALYSRHPKDESMALTLIGAIVAVAAVPFTAGASLGVGVAWAAAGSAISVAGAVAGSPDEPPPPKIKGDSPAEIINSMRSGLNALNRQLFNSEVFIMEHLDDVSKDVSGTVGYRHLPHIPDEIPVTSQIQVQKYHLPRPALADSTPSNINDQHHLGGVS